MSEQLRLETFVVERFCSTPYYDFAILCFAELIRLDQADRGRGWVLGLDDSAIIAQIGSDPVGILTFDPLDPARAKVGIAFVSSDYRRRGIFRFMLDELVKWAERNGRHQVELDAPIQNAAIGKAMAAIGASVVSQCHRITI